MRTGKGVPAGKGNESLSEAIMCLDTSLTKGNDDAAEGATPVKFMQLEDRDGVASVLVTLRTSRFKSV